MKNKSILLYLTILFKIISLNIGFAQWDKTTCGSYYHQVNSRLIGPQTVCPGESVSIELELGQTESNPRNSGLTNYEIQILNNNNQYTGLNKTGSQANTTTASRILSFTIPNGFSSGTYHFDIITNGTIAGVGNFNQKCSMERGFIVSTTPAAPNISSNVSSICSGQSATLTAANCIGTVKWSGGQTGPSVTVSPTATTAYTATCQSTCGTSGNSNSISISIGATPAAPNISSNVSSICSGQSATLTAANCSGTVKWSGGQTGSSVTVSPTATTAYTATCQTTCGTSGNSSSVTISIGAAPAAPTLSRNTSDGCSIQSATLTASNCSGIVKWSNGQTGVSISVTPAGTISYTATCQTGCGISVNSNAIYVLEAPIKPTISGNNAFCVGGSTSLTASNAQGYYYYTWLNDKTGPLGGTYILGQSSVPVTTEGNYSATVYTRHVLGAQNIVWCPSTSDVYIVQKSQPSVSISGNNTFCAGTNNNLNANITLTTNRPVTTFQWQKDGQNTGNNGSSLNIVESGTYSIKITDQIGCSATSNSFSVIVNPVPVINLTNASVGGTDTYAPTNVASGGTPPFSYQWTTSPVVTGSGSTSASPTFGPFTQNSTISLTVKDSKGCSVSKDIPISWTQCTPPTAQIASTKTEFCENTSLKISSQTTGGVPGYIYQWLNNGNTIVNATTANLDVTVSGVYQLQVTDSKNCTTRSNTISASVLLRAKVQKITALSATTFCDGGSVDLKVENTGTAIGLTYKWLKDNVIQTNTSVGLTANQSGNYTVIAQNTCNADTLKTPVKVTVNPNPVINLTDSPVNGTDTFSPTNVVSGGMGPYTYSWITNPVVTGNGFTNANPTLGPFSQETNTISLNVTDRNGCIATKSIVITWKPCTPPTASIIKDKAVLCDGVPLKLITTAIGGAGGFSYQWKKNGNLINNAINADYTISEAGDYTITVTDSKQCTVNTTINIQKLNPTVSISGKLEFCVGGSTQLVASTQNTNGLIGYQWKEGMVNTGDGKATLITNKTSDFGLEITDALGCKATATAVSVKQNALPVINPIAGKSVTCTETYLPTGSITGGSPPYRYYWSASPAIASKDTSTNQPTFGPFTQNTTVTLRITDAKGCIGNAQSNVTYIPPNINITLTGNDNYCSGKNSPLSVTISNATLPLNKLSWQRNGQEVAKDVSAFIAAQAGSYTVQVIDSKGCSKTSSMLLIAENPSPTITITGPNFYCYGTTITLSANVSSGTAPFKYSWSLKNNPLTTTAQTHPTSTEGDYVVSVLDSKGCEATANKFNLAEKGSDIVSIVKPDGPITVYAPNTAALSATLGYEKDPRFKYQWRKDGKDIAGAAHYVHYAATSGSYAATISDADCAVTSSEVKVAVLVPTAVSLSATDELLIYPNPTDGLVIISAHLRKMTNLTVKLIDLQGRIIETFELSKYVNFENRLDLSSYPSGTYFLEIEGKELMKRIKIVKK